jgi:hypothetical protein
VQALLYVDLVTGTVSDTLGGSSFAWPQLVEGDDIRLSLRLSQKIDGADNEVHRVVHGLRATLGRVNARPEDGTVKLSIDGAITTTLTVTTSQTVNGVTTIVPLSASDLQEAINAALPAHPCTVAYRDGSYLIIFNDGLRRTITTADNLMFPLSITRVREAQLDGKWVHELRFLQLPVAFTSAFARVVPPAPVITRIQAGGYDGTQQWNEVQRIFIPPAFRGTYQIRRGFRKSAIFSKADGPDELMAGMTPLLDIGGEFAVINTDSNTGHIEFKGSMEGQPWPLLEIAVFDAPQGDLTVHLSLSTAEMSALLWRNRTETLPLEVEAILEDEADSNVLETVTLIRADLTVVSELAYAELDTPQNIEWMRPPAPVDYVPVTNDQRGSGSQHVTVELGDGVLTEFTVDHHLATDALHVTLRENKASGRELVNGTDYDLVFNDANSLTVTLTGAASPVPAAAALLLSMSTAGARLIFQAHTHSIEQIEGLRTLLDGIGSDVQTLLELVPTGALISNGVSESDTPTAQWTLPALFEVYPTRTPIKAVEALDKITPEMLPRPGGLFAAVHAASIEALTIPVPLADAAFIGRVFQNTGSDTITLSGGLKHRSIQLKTGELAACDGRMWYRVTRYGTEKSFYPTDFDRTLFEFSVNSNQLRLKKKLELQIGIEVAVLNSNTRAQWMLVIEHGAFTADTEPATTGPNLKEIEWHTTPILSQLIEVMSVPAVHTFGCRLTRSLVTVSGVTTDTIAAAAIAYGGETAGGSAPASANFALRARMIRFDTENSQTDPKGFVALRGLAVAIGGKAASGDDVLGKAIIKGA